MTPYFIQAFIYLCAAVVAVPLAKRFGLGSVLGYLIAGVVIGPVVGLVGEETQTLQHFAEFGVRAVDCGGALIREYNRKPIRVEVKGDGSPVTSVDQIVEDQIREMIAALWRKWPLNAAIRASAIGKPICNVSAMNSLGSLLMTCKQSTYPGSLRTIRLCRRPILQLVNDRLIGDCRCGTFEFVINIIYGIN